MLLGAANLVSLFLRLYQILDARGEFVKRRRYYSQKDLQLPGEESTLPLTGLWGMLWEPGR
jgi:hypothetical protein